MSDTITTKDGVTIYYKDWGSGQPIVFSHGWPLSADDWDTQMLFFLNKGFRVIAHDRRGHGRSTQTGEGHDMDHKDFLTACPRLKPRRSTRTCWRSSRANCRHEEAAAF
ncbi:MAG TPA: alpha/beta hydrolase [Steroidobacteraceae bacterium]|nr:alpha/beta hydrolase [Steroidobacteraceae bacterium]